MFGCPLLNRVDNRSSENKEEEMKHTPGTWRAKDGQIYSEDTGKTIALIPYYDEDNKEQGANAKLIEAAPSLLKACKHLVIILGSEGEEFYNKHIAAFNMGISAIAQTTGE